MTSTALSLIYLGAVLLVGGVALVYVPAAVILAGLALLAAGVLSLERPDPREERRS